MTLFLKIVILLIGHLNSGFILLSYGKPKIKNANNSF